MTKVNFNPSDFDRSVSDTAALMLKNRYFEKNPVLTDDGAGLLARPGMRLWTQVGTGPIRGMESEPGSFTGDMFVVSGDSCYRVKKDKTNTTIVSGLFHPETGFVNMAVTASIGATPAYMFLADGRNLFVYTDTGYAQGTLTGIPANTNVVLVGTVYYQFTSGSVAAGTPAGTLANPWLVALGGSSTIALNNLRHAINASGGVAGTDYTLATTANTLATSTFSSTNTLKVRAVAIGLAGNTVVTTETGAALAWTGGTLAGGGSPSMTPVVMPDDMGAIDVAVINSYVIVIPVQEDEFVGRFYFIEPGETTVDPLNYATAERSPDAIQGVNVFGDQFWLNGQVTSEAWYITGDLNAPVRRLQGVVYDRGTWGDTSVTIDEVMMVVDPEGGVFLLAGGQPKRVSTSDIEEQIRKAINYENSRTLLI